MYTPSIIRLMWAATSSLLILGVAQPAQATLVAWNLQNVTFEDGGTASGLFVILPSPSAS